MEWVVENQSNAIPHTPYPILRIPIPSIAEHSTSTALARGGGLSPDQLFGEISYSVKLLASPSLIYDYTMTRSRNVRVYRACERCRQRKLKCDQ